LYVGHGLSFDLQPITHPDAGEDFVEKALEKKRKKKRSVSFAGKAALTVIKSKYLWNILFGRQRYCFFCFDVEGGNICILI
jgi:hypothetical protein